jgi:hypothetical protein
MVLEWYVVGKERVEVLASVLPGRLHRQYHPVFLRYVYGIENVNLWSVSWTNNSLIALWTCPGLGEVRT